MLIKSQDHSIQDYRIRTTDTKRRFIKPRRDNFTNNLAYGQWGLQLKSEKTPSQSSAIIFWSALDIREGAMIGVSTFYR